MSHKDSEAMTHDPSVAEDGDTSPAKLNYSVRFWLLITPLAMA